MWGKEVKIRIRKTEEMPERHWRKGILLAKYHFPWKWKVGWGCRITFLFCFNKEVQLREMETLMQWFSNFSAHLNHLESILKHWLLSPAPKSFWSNGLKVGWEFTFLTNSQVRLVLLILDELRTTALNKLDKRQVGF